MIYTEVARWRRLRSPHVSGLCWPERKFDGKQSNQAPAALVTHLERSAKWARPKKNSYELPKTSQGSITRSERLDIRSEYSASCSWDLFHGHSVDEPWLRSAKLHVECTDCWCGYIRAVHHRLLHKR